MAGIYGERRTGDKAIEDPGKKMAEMIAPGCLAWPGEDVKPEGR